MSAPPVLIDFANARPRAPRAGLVLLVLGIAVASATLLEYRAIEAQRAGLELKLAVSTRHSQRDPADAPRRAHASEEATRVARELGTPWTTLLAELEAASRDSQGQISVLSIEPDHEKHRVHISGESRNLPVALAYIEKLQAARSLRYPMLDSHDVKTDDAQRPVRFALTAEWRELP